VIRSWKRLLCAGLLALAAGEQATAQSDYRNLDAGRPIAVEDAQPVEFRELELQTSLPRFSREGKGKRLLAIESELKWGVLKDTQAGVSDEFVVVRDQTNTRATWRDTQIHLLYNFNQETRRLPAIAIRPELDIRSGGLGSQHEHAAWKMILTKTAQGNRFHLNGSYTLGPTETRGRGGDLVSRFFYGAAYERTFPLHFVVLLADVYARKPIDGSRTQAVFELGTRVQVAPRWVLDGGISAGLRTTSSPDVGFTFGLNYSFSFRGLFPGRAKPNP